MKHILVVQDDFIIAHSLKNYLSNMGYKVTTIVSEGWKVIDYVKQDQFDLILVNVKMQSSSNGIEVMSEIRTFSSIPVIYLTSLVDKDTMNRAEKTQPCSFVKKPIDYNELNGAIDQFL